MAKKRLFRRTNMSIDLDWAKLDASLSASLIDVLNTHLQSAAASQPSFIGPIQITSFDFGSQPPDVELIDLRNIYRDFLDDNDDDEEQDSSSSSSHSPRKTTQHDTGALDEDEDDGFEWVSRRAAAKVTAMQDEYHYHHLPPHVRYGRGPSSASEVFSLAPAHASPYTNSTAWATGPAGLTMSMPSLPPRPLVGRTMSALGTPLVGTPGIGMGMSMGLGMGLGSALPSRSQSMYAPSPVVPTPSSQSPQPTPPSNSALPPPEADTAAAGESEQPDLQIHLHITWPSNLRLTLTTSLRINYPSPMFMSLPIKLSVTGLLFTGEVAVAYEGSRRRVHLCILDDQDPYGPAVGRPRRDKDGAEAADSGHGNSDGREGGDGGVDDEGGSGSGRGGSSGSGNGQRRGKPLPIGQRLLPNIFIESELGQADKHVLKNVTRVEKFIQDVIRKTIEEEFVFPNFHTLVLP